MKTLTTTILLAIVLTVQSRAQGVLGIFTQQDTKDKDMIEQIALYETYLGELKSGYKTTRNGLNTIHDLKNGTFNLHSDYFSSLGQLNPQVAKDPKVKAITQFQQQIITLFTRAIARQKQQGMLTAGELSYVQSVYDNLLGECNNDLNALSDLVTSGKLQLKDEERLKRIDALYNDMKDKYAFTQYFTANMQSLAKNRQDERDQSKMIKQLYNLN